MAAQKILIVQGHPDGGHRHLGHALADAYAVGAEAAGHEVRRLDIAHLAFEAIATQEEFERGTPPPDIAAAQDAIRWANHVVMLFPLWLGTVPARTKAFLEHVMRPHVAFAYSPRGFPRKLLKGRSARLVVTMGMPALLYRWYFGAFGVRGIERNILSFVGFDPVRTTLLGGVGQASARRRAAWLSRMTRLGGQGK
jgi:putative NADPH-quinone reductase